MKQQKTYYRRHLPHWQPEGATFHIVFRLTGSLPAEVIQRLRMEQEQNDKTITAIKDEKRRQEERYTHRAEYFEKFDALLSNNAQGPVWLRKPEIAGIIKEALHYRDVKEYDLLAYCIMPNHVHVVFVSRADCPTYTVTDILRKLKWNTALKANRVLNRTGAFWQDESYDHVIRDENELERTILYVLNNPVKAGFVNSWEKWQWTYCKP